jgi:hypothetical protein
MTRTDRKGEVRPPGFGWLRPADRAARWARLVLLALWRTRFPPPAERARRRLYETTRDHRAAEARVAAEEFHWIARSVRGGEHASISERGARSAGWTPNRSST